MFINMPVYLGYRLSLQRPPIDCSRRLSASARDPLGAGLRFSFVTSALSSPRAFGTRTLNKMPLLHAVQSALLPSSRVAVRSQFQRSTFPRVLNSYSRLVSTMVPKVSVDRRPALCSPTLNAGTDVLLQLRDPSLLKQDVCYVNGEWVKAKSGKTFEVFGI